MESKNLSTEDSKSENIAKKQKQDFSSQASALSKEPQNQRPPSKDGGLTIGLKAGPVDKSTCFSSSHTLNPSGTSD